MIKVDVNLPIACALQIIGVPVGPISCLLCCIEKEKLHYKVN